MKKALIGVTVTATLTLAAWALGGSLVASGSSGPAPTGWTPRAGLPLSQGEPAQLHPDKDGVTHVKLVASSQTIAVSGTTLQATPFNGRLQGPTIHTRAGGTIRVTFVNDLKASTAPGEKAEYDTNIHYHGLHVSPLDDHDNIFRTFPQSSTTGSVVHLPHNQEPGTFWYHVHFHGVSDQQIMGGLSGLLIVDGLTKHLPPDLRGVQQQQFGLRTVQVVNGQIQGENNITPGLATATPLVNTLYQPTYSMPQGRYQLWRLGNIGSDDFLKVALEGHKFAIIAEDGAPAWKVVEREELVLPPGKRYDVLVYAGRPGTYRLQSRPIAQSATQDPGKPITPQWVPPLGTTTTLATVTVKPVLRRPKRPKLPLSAGPKSDLGTARVDEARTFTFSYLNTPPEDPNFAAINGKTFSPDMMPAAAPVLGTVEEWTLINKTKDDHPFHIHVNDFLVMSINGEPQHPNSEQDVVTIPKQRTVNGETEDGEVVIRQRYTDFTGWFVFHCHILDHEDFGMMATIQVRKHASDPIIPPPQSDLPSTMPHH